MDDDSEFVGRLGLAINTLHYMLLEAEKHGIAVEWAPGSGYTGEWVKREKLQYAIVRSTREVLS